MAQPINFSINVSPIALIVAVVVSHTLFKDRYGEVVQKRLHDMIDLFYAAGKNLILDSPVIALTSGLTYAVQHLAPYAPALVLSSEAMLAATFVGGIFALKSVMNPLLEKVIEVETSKLIDNVSVSNSLSSYRKKEVPGEYLIRNVIVLHLLPLALGTLYAYYASVPVKLAQSALYTATLIGSVKLLGYCIESFCKMDTVKETIQNWYFGLDK
jgi:hypothetical protein